MITEFKKIGMKFLPGMNKDQCAINNVVSLIYVGCNQDGDEYFVLVLVLKKLYLGLFGQKC